MIEVIQRELEDIYDLPNRLRIEDFLINQKELGQFFPIENVPPSIDEQLVLREEGDQSISLGLYIRQDILERLHAFSPKNKLDENNLSEFCALVEGVSHFLLLDFRTTHNFRLSALELETQAEIDKFVTSFLYQFGQNTSLSNLQRKIQSQNLYENIFSHFNYRPGLAVAEQERYEKANKTAGAICRFILKQFLFRTQPKWPEFFHFLRRFYRLGWNEKLIAIRED